MEIRDLIFQNDIEAIRKWLKKGKIWRKLMSVDREGLTPMATAIKYNRLDIVKVLLEAYKEFKIDINAKDKGGYTILHLAVQSTEKVLMSFLQFEGIDVNVQNADKNRPLHYFCQWFLSPNCSKPFKLMLDKGCDVNAQNKNGETALHKAIFNNSVRLLMVELLLKNGADVNVLNNKGESALHYAVRLGRDDLVSVLLKHGADATIAGIRDKKTPFQLAIQEQREDIADRIGMHQELLEWLHDMGLDACASKIVREELYLDVLVDADDLVLTQLLSGMGIAAGHQIKFMKAVKSLKDSAMGSGIEFPSVEESSEMYDEGDDDSEMTETGPEDTQLIRPRRRPPSYKKKNNSFPTHFPHRHASDASLLFPLPEELEEEAPPTEHSTTTSPTYTSENSPHNSPALNGSRHLPAEPSNFSFSKSQPSLSRENSPSGTLDAPPTAPRTSHTKPLPPVPLAGESPPSLRTSSSASHPPVNPSPGHSHSHVDSLANPSSNSHVNLPINLPVNTTVNNTTNSTANSSVNTTTNSSSNSTSNNTTDSTSNSTASITTNPTSANSPVTINPHPVRPPLNPTTTSTNLRPKASNLPSSHHLTKAASLATITTHQAINTISVHETSITGEPRPASFMGTPPVAPPAERENTLPSITVDPEPATVDAPPSITVDSDPASVNVPPDDTSAPVSSPRHATSNGHLSPGNRNPSHTKFIRRNPSSANLQVEQPPTATSRKERPISKLYRHFANFKHSGPAPLLPKDHQLEFTGKLGAGSSGKVYKGLYEGNMVAIKVLKNLARLEEEEGIEEFRKEFEIMSAIRTPHSVYFYGATLEPKICMVMEYCSRGSLYHVLNSAKYNMGWDQLFHYAMEATAGIKELHSLDPQIVHRDIKSLNFLVTDNFDVKVCDFGLSRFNTGSNMSTLQRLRGTYAYCAPEVYNTEQFSTKSDIYSIGIVFWELVTRCIKGRYERPYSEYKHLMFDFQIIIQAAKMGLRPTIPENCPAGWKGLILSCIDGSPEKRPTSEEILSILDELCKEYAENMATWDALVVPRTA